jgi:drug/metabolite transporter (DMT)-like permease
VAAVGLALAASVAWGLADFLGGLLSRRLTVSAVVLVGNGTGLVATAVAASALGHLDRRAVGIGVVAGLFGGVGAASYYQALSTGTMSVVAPIASCGALVSLALALGAGERPSPVSLAGALIAVSGAVLASTGERRKSRLSGQAVLYAALTAVMFGVLLYLLGRASDEGGVLPALFGARAGSVAILLLWLGPARPAFRLDRPALVVAAAVVGTMAVAANGLYGAGAQRGLISIVSVIASLYPVTTVALAHAVLGERIERIQSVGIAAAMAGVPIAVLGSSG